MREELKPCPFCGGKAVRFESNSGFWYRCNECKAESGFYYTDEEAAEAWNKRVYEEDGGRAMSINYNKCKEMSDFWKEISRRLDHLMTYMRNDSHVDGEYVNIACSLLTSAQKLCEYRAKVQNEKCEALEKLAEA